MKKFLMYMFDDIRKIQIKFEEEEKKICPKKTYKNKPNPTKI